MVSALVLDRPQRLTGAAIPRRGFLRDLEQPRQALAHLGPNWFAAVMGTGIVANAAASLPLHLVGLRAFAEGVWVLATAMLLALGLATAIHWALHRDNARGHALNPVMSQFYGAPPMALLTVGAGALLVGKDLIGLRAAVDLDWALWTAGTLSGLLASAAVPYLMFTRHEINAESTFASWLMPIVPPMVSAATGALLVAHAPAGQARLTLLLGCYAMFGLSLFASVIVITLVWLRLVQHKTGPAAMVPTLWIVLGPLGQSITAANLLANVAPRALPAPYAAGMQVLGLAYGVITWGFAALWFSLAAAMTVRTARQHLPFALTWWSFTFPVGTCVTGTSALAVRSGADLFRYAAVGLYAFLVLAWLTVWLRTARGTYRGRLLQAPVPVPVVG